MSPRALDDAYCLPQRRSLPAGRADPAAGQRLCQCGESRVEQVTRELGGQPVLGPARQSVVVGDRGHPVMVVPFTVALEAVDEREARAGGADPTPQVLSEPVNAVAKVSHTLVDEGLCDILAA
jgi:hypothetical protein